MAEQPAVLVEGSKPATRVSPADNLDKWLSEKTGDAKPEPAAAQLTEAPAEPPQPAHSWRDEIVGDDVEHGFFKGKKFAEVIKSYEHSERSKQEAERRANESQRQLDQIQRERDAELAARRVLAERVTVSTDPYAEIEQLWFENPKAAAAKLRETITAETRQTLERESARVRSENQEEMTKRDIMTRGEQAFNAAREALNVPQEVWNKRGKAVLVEVTDRNGPYYAQGGPLSAPNLISAYKDIFGDAPVAPAAVSPQAPQLATPPGAKKPAAAAIPSPAPSPMNEEKRRAWESAAEAAGISPEKFIKRMNGASRG